MVASALWLAGGVLPVSAQETVGVDLTVAVHDILTKHCGDCHSPGNTNPFDFAGDLSKLAASKLVNHGSLPQSSLYIRMASGEMPPPGEEVYERRPTDEEIATVGRWITENCPTTPGTKGVPPKEETADKTRPQPLGAQPTPNVPNTPAVPNTPTVVPARPFITLHDEMFAVHGYLRGLDVSIRPFQRFISLRTWANNSSRTPRELDLARAAVGKTLNSLSWRQKMLTPIALDAQAVVFAYDMRDLAWTEDTWNLLVSRYPYGLRHDLLPDDRALNEASLEIYAMTGTDIPIIRADWFVARATRPPLYHDLLGIPKHETELETRLGVNAHAEIARGNTKRAGMIKSGISQQHRIVERFDSTFGYYWKSYDFRPEAERGDITRFPLGPVFRQNPAPEFAFTHDGGEFIFRLPNGLQGYMLVNGTGDRIDEGPADVVADAKRVSGDYRIINGVSCMACHSQGTIQLSDAVRDSTALQGESLRLVRQMYLPRDEMARWVKSDGDEFRVACVKAMGSVMLDPSLCVQSDGQIIEPITDLAKFYAVDPLDVQDLAAELGLQDPSLLQAAVQLDDRFRDIGLGVLATDQGCVKRHLWENAEAFVSPFQRAANLLKLGTPKAVMTSFE